MEKISTEELNAIEYVPPLTGGKVIKVYDGDTITICQRIGENEDCYYKFPIRIKGIDCPEMRSSDEDEKRLAGYAQKALEKLLLGNYVRLEEVENDKYGGRYVAKVIFGKVKPLNISQFMLDLRFAVPYDGGKKNPPQNWMNYYLNGTL